MKIAVWHTLDTAKRLNVLVLGPSFSFECRLKGLQRENVSVQTISKLNYSHISFLRRPAICATLLANRL